MYLVLIFAAFPDTPVPTTDGFFQNIPSTEGVFPDNLSIGAQNEVTPKYGCAASGGALALDPPLFTRSQQEVLGFAPTTLFFQNFQVDPLRAQPEKSVNSINTSGNQSHRKGKGSKDVTSKKNSRMKKTGKLKIIRRPTEVMGAEGKKEKKNYSGTQPKALVGWPKRLRLVQETPRADFAVGERF